MRNFFKYSTCVEMFIFISLLINMIFVVASPSIVDGTDDRRQCPCYLIDFFVILIIRDSSGCLDYWIIRLDFENLVYIYIL